MTLKEAQHAREFRLGVHHKSDPGRIGRLDHFVIAPRYGDRRKHAEIEWPGGVREQITLGELKLAGAIVL